MTNYIVLMNPFTLKKDEVTYFLKRWRAVAEYLRAQSGFIEAELHQGIHQSEKWFNYAKWQSIEDFQRAIATPEFKQLTTDFPGEGSPGLYNVAVRI